MRRSLFLSAVMTVSLAAEDECCEPHGHFQTITTEREPDWSYIKDQSDWPGKREDSFVEALKGN